MQQSASQHKRFLHRVWAARYLYLMFLPVLIYYVVFRYAPMAGLSIAFKDFNAFLGFAKSKWVGFKYFDQFINSIYLWRLVRNTLLINLYDLLFNFPASIILALMLNELRKQRFKKIVQTITYMPYFISSVVIASMLVQFLSPSSGLVNNMIAALGGQRQYFMTQAESFRAIYTLMNLWKNIGWNSIIFLAAMSSINVELYEACIVDGGGHWRRMWSVTLPGILSTIVVLLIMRLGHVMDAGYETILLLQNNANLETSDVIGTYVYRRGLKGGEYSYATAVGMMQSVIGFSLVIGANYLSRRYSETSLW
ncbi:MAG: ABC transporter permease subunit [Eubacteriales bacterium]|nr:ABC transporter permease subunit [Eubacteriales bacterium]